MYKFLVENWQFIGTAILSLLTIILAFCKRKPKVYGWYLDCIDLVKQAESLFPGSGRGSEKLSWVIESFCKKHDLVNDKFHVQMISQMVDKVMTSPKRKEKQ